MCIFALARRGITNSALTILYAKVQFRVDYTSFSSYKLIMTNLVSLIEEHIKYSGFIMIFLSDFSDSISII